MKQIPSWPVARLLSEREEAETWLSLAQRSQNETLIGNFEAKLDAINSVLEETNFSESNSPLAVQEQLWKDQAAAQEIMAKRNAFDTRLRQGDVTANQFKLQSDQLLGEAEKASRKIGGNVRGRSAVRLKKLPEKFVAAAQIAIKSGRLKGEVLESLEEMATIENAIVITGIMAFYAGVHGTPAAPLALVLDVFLTVSGGKDIALALQRIYLALDSARDEQGLNDAADVLIEELSGPLADCIVSLLMWGLGRAAGKVFGKKKKTNNQSADADVTANSPEGTSDGQSTTNPSTTDAMEDIGAPSKTYRFEKQGISYESEVIKNADGSTSISHYAIKDGSRKLVGVSEITSDGKLTNGFEVPNEMKNLEISKRMYAEAESVGFKSVEGQYCPSSDNFKEFFKHYDPAKGNAAEALYQTPAGKVAKSRGLKPTTIKVTDKSVEVTWTKE